MTAFYTALAYVALAVMGLLGVYALACAYLSRRDPGLILPRSSR